MADIIEAIRARLFEMQDLKYKDFHCRLMPTVAPELVIGVRTPQLRAFAKELYTSGDASAFISALPHKYYEENNLHGFIICFEKDYEKAISLTNAFLPYIDNWATCDLLSPKIFKKHLSELYEEIKKWVSCDMPYTVRFGIEMLMSFYLDGEYKREYSELAAAVRSDEYYVNMMQAWYFATALAKQWPDALTFIQNNALDRQTHNKAIQKAIESRRITPEQKEYLRAFKR